MDLSGITAEHKLKHAKTVDKSVPRIEKGVKIKKVDRTGFLKEVTKEHPLKHTKTVDKSAPLITKDIHVGASKRPALLAEIKAKAH